MEGDVNPGDTNGRSWLRRGLASALKPNFYGTLLMLAVVSPVLLFSRSVVTYFPDGSVGRHLEFIRLPLVEFDSVNSLIVRPLGWAALAHASSGLRRELLALVLGLRVVTPSAGRPRRRGPLGRSRRLLVSG